MLFGDYKLKFNAFASDDGKLYDSTNVINSLSLDIRLDGSIGLTGEIPLEKRLLKTDEARDPLRIAIKADRGVEKVDDKNGCITVVLSKRNATYVDEVYQPVSYRTIDLNNYVVDSDDLTLATTERGVEEGIFSDKEYFVTETSSGTEEFTIDFDLNLVENISTGEYKLTFNVYSAENNLIETVEKTFIVIN